MKIINNKHLYAYLFFTVFLALNCVGCGSDDIIEPNSPAKPTDTIIKAPTNPANPTNPTEPEPEPEPTGEELNGVMIYGNPTNEKDFPPANAFDSDSITYFRSNNGPADWLGLDLSERYVITAVGYCPRIDMASPDYPDRLRLAIIEGANNADFSDALPLHIISDVALRKTNLANIRCSRSFRFVRFVFPDAQIGGGKSNYIAELKFYGYKADGNDTRLPQLTNLPTISIRTVNNSPIASKTNWVNGNITVVFADGTKSYSDDIEIRGRGNASWGFPKKPYRFKLANSTNFMELPAKARNWTLINNYGDKTLMRNILAFDFSRRIDMPYTSPAIAVDVVVNSDYKGCYQLCDHIDVRKNRVDIEEMTNADLQGGYFIEIDAYANSEETNNIFTSNNYNLPVTVKYPDTDEITAAQLQYVINHFNAFAQSVAGSQYNDLNTGFRRYLDIDVFARYFLVGEYSGNTDTFWGVNMWKTRFSEKFVCAPVWDFDIAFENDNRTYPVNTRWGNEWMATCAGSSAAGNAKELVRRILTDVNFNNQLRTIWNSYRKSAATKQALLATVDSCANLLNNSQKLNFLRWQIMNQFVHQNPVIHGSYEAEVANVKKFINDRIDWLDNKLK
jgi:hypothetical protein